MENPKCPYCGGEMEYQDQWVYPFYICSNCYSQSPRTTKIKRQEEAYAAAMKRDRANGKWISNKNGWYECSKCGHEMFFTGTFDSEQRFCYYCGADMRKEANDEP